MPETFSVDEATGIAIIRSLGVVTVADLNGSLEHLKAYQQSNGIRKYLVNTLEATSFPLTLEYYAFGERVALELPGSLIAIVAKMHADKIMHVAQAAKPGVACRCAFF